MLDTVIMLNEVNYRENPSLRDVTLSEGLQFGLGVFETMRRLPEGIEDFEAHMDRLRNSATQLRIPIPMDFENVHRLKTYLESFSVQEADGPMTQRPIGVLKLALFKQGDSSRWMVSERPFPYTKIHLEEGFGLTVSQVHRNSTSVFQRHKTLNYGENWLEKQKAIENGYQEVLFLNEKQELTETSASNIFFYKGGRWHTPEKNCGLLQGIMRRRMMDYFIQIGQPVAEGSFVLEDILSSERVVLTNALMGLMPVRAIGSRQFDVKSCDEIINYNVIDPARLLFE